MTTPLSSLDQLQQEIATGLLNAEQPAPATIVQRNREGTSRRYNIYRNNRATSLIDNLCATYPVTRQLVGVDYFNAVARLYIDKRPPASPVMMEYGAGFGDFLCQLPSAKSIGYVADVATIEWLCNEAFHAKDAKPLELSELGRISPEVLAISKFELHPSARLLSSSWPAGSIWKTTNSAGDTSSAKINMQQHEHILVLRAEWDVNVYILNQPMMQFLRELENASTLTEAASEVIETTPDFDIGTALTTLVEFCTFHKVGES